MTRKEAISELIEMCNYINCNIEIRSKQYNALNMAIEALKREQQLLDAGYQNVTVNFYIGGRLFRAKEIAQ